MSIVKQRNIDIGHLSILFYGKKGTGKTPVAAQFPEPLFLQCNPHGLVGLRNVDFIPVVALDDLPGAINEALAAPGYRSIVLDDITYLITQEGRRLGTDSTDENGRKVKAMRNELIYRKITALVLPQFDRLFKSGKIVIATGHERETDIASTHQEDGKSIPKSYIGLDANATVAEAITGLFSVVAYTYPTKDGNVARTRVLDTPTQTIMARDRYSLLPEIVKMDAGAIMDVFRKGFAAGKPANTEGAAK